MDEADIMNGHPDSLPAGRPFPVTIETSFWTAADVSAIANGPFPAIAPIAAQWRDCRLPERDIWDMWPVADENGKTICFAAGRLWMALVAPALGDPEDRHFVARIHFLVEDDGGFNDAGPAFSDLATPGSREWSGCAVFDPGSGRLTCWFTASGRRGEQTPSFDQRLFSSHGTLQWVCGLPRVHDWSIPTELVCADGASYVRVAGTAGGAGTIKAFRDPAHFRDPQSGRHMMVFAGSDARSDSAWNGVIGFAVSQGGLEGPWHLLPPLISADGLNNELERPHLHWANGRYYLFWSTQAKVFADTVAPGPTGLYGMVASSPFGPFSPLNGSGLVAANPPEAPWQAFSWWVLDDLSVTSFADLPGLSGQSGPIDAKSRRAWFAGFPAPYFTIALGYDTAVIVGDD